jgi:hypothetical protein
MASVSTMVISSLISVGKKAIGGTLTANEGTHYLGKFNSFLESLSQERLMIYQITTDSFSLSANVSTYTIGPSGTVNTDRPNKIVNAYVRDSSGYDHPLDVVEQPTYWDIGAKAQTATWPDVVYYDNGFSATSTGTLHFAPVPSEANTVYLNSYKQLTTVAHLSTNVLFPPGYQRMIESNFALEVANLKDPPALVMKIARDSKSVIKGINAPSTILSLDSGIVRGARRGNVLDGP